MSEYITKWVVRPENKCIREEIVRCRDCRQYRERINGCAEFGDESRDEFANVEPDGFCAWGKRRD